MKKNITFILFFILYQSLFSQQFQLTGKVTGEKKAHTEFVEILILKKDSVAIKSQLADEKGLFSIQVPKGEYVIQIRQLGGIIYSKNFDLKNDLNLGEIRIEKIKNIKEIVLEGKKRLIERKVDRIIFNVENSISATGGDALDALRVAPSVRVQNDQISMIGKSGMSVMVDDRLVQLSGTDLINFLKTIKSDNIKSIEVIASPPAKYDAEGNNGIVNIKLKEAKSNSWSNTIRTTYKQATYPSFSIGNNFTYQKNKLSLLFDLSANKDISIYTNDINYYYPQEYWESSIYNKTRADRISTILNLKYNLTKTLNIGFQYLGNISNPKTDEIGASDIYNIENLNLNRVLRSLGYTKRDNNNHSLNFNLLKKLDTLGKQFTVDIDYFTYGSDKNNTLNAENTNNNSFSSTKQYIENINLQKINNFSAKIDFDLPYKWATLSFGGKLSFTKSNNNINISRYDTSEVSPILESNQSDEFTYNENIQSAYFSANRKFGTKWEGKAGLRAEFTENKGYSQQSNQTNKNNYIKLFPTFYLSYQHNKENTFSISYGRRINRPSYSNLNPARWYLNANSYEEGNPFLQPSFTTNIELSHSYKDLLTTTLSFSTTKNGFGQLTIHDLQNDIQSFIRRNYYDYNNFSWSEYINYTIFPWWNTSAEAAIYYTETKAYSEYLNPKYSGWGGYFSNTNDFTLNKRKTFLAQLIYEYTYPTIFNENRTDSYSNLGIAIKLLFLEKKLQIVLNANNILGSDRIKTSNITQGINQNFRQYYDTQYVRLSLSYKFGNKNLNTRKKDTGNEEEKARSN
ncbi:TonB-dependent receptor domain-containing protein [Elizabethkingia anophelis]|uniref:TonB-dependent receptor domain-containing protein n=1 Tax=Elizabethkingia anophelis TaxID=1117645 RepID=UPI00355716AB